MTALAQAQAELDILKAAGLYRGHQTISRRQLHLAEIAGQQITLFCSNDYLGLSQHPAVIAALQKGAQDWGAGAGAAHLISGHNQPHAQLEEAFAEFMGYESALLFSTGYMANLGVISALAGRHDVVLQDKLNHASLLDGCKLSGAALKRFRHVDTTHLESKLPAKMVATDSVFSMDGDVAPLNNIARAAASHNSLLLVDDAHGFGTLGPQGRGSVAAAGLNSDDVPLLLCTLGKAAGTFGAVLLGSRAHIELCINRARSYMYTTALPAAMASASLAALNLIRDGDELRNKLNSNIALFKDGATHLGLNVMPSNTAIQPIIVGSNQAALAASQHLLKSGFLVSAIRSPTVNKGSERLRITLSSDHSATDIEKLLAALATLPSTI